MVILFVARSRVQHIKNIRLITTYKMQHPYYIENIVLMTTYHSSLRTFYVNKLKNTVCLSLKQLSKIWIQI